MAEPDAARPTAEAPPRVRRGPRVAGYLILAVLVFIALTEVGLGRYGTTTAELLRGPDDYMRIVRVDDLLAGQGWTDTVERRIDPPEGVRLHWSRLSDLPVAAAVLAAEPALGADGARRLAVIAVPALLGAAFAALFVWAAVPLARGAPLMLPMLMLGTVTVPLLQYLPGRIDHHGIQLLFAALGAGLLFRALGTGEGKWAAGLGLAGGTALAVGLEALPWLGAATVALALYWVWRGGAGARVFLVFGAALFASALALIPATLPPELWGRATCDQLSVAQLALIAIVPLAGAVAVTAERLAPSPGPALRFALAAAVGALGLAAVAWVFPQCLTGPYGELSPGLRFWLESVSEAQPFWRYALGKPGGALSFALVPAAGALAAAWGLARAGRRARPLAAAALLLALTGLALLAWQIRGATYAALFGGLALTPLAAAFDARADRIRPDRVWAILARLGLRVSVPLLAALAVLVPYVALQLPADAVHAARAGCKLGAAIEALGDPARLGARPLTLAAPIFEGPEILYHTRHRVLAAPYHRNARGIQDNRLIFAGTEAEALAVIRRRGVGAVLYCRDHGPPPQFAGRTPFLRERLRAGRPPAWLEPVMVEAGVALYRVRGAGGGAP